MPSSLVSVIIPAYNAEEYIFECVNSVINQTYKNIELIVINDGSTDSTKEILESFHDPRIKIVNQKNKGCSASKNRGLNISKGDFIQYLDADDYLSYDKIEKQVELIKLKENCIAVCKTVIISDNLEINGLEIDTEMIQKGGTGKDFLLRLLGLNGMVQPNAYLISRKIAHKIGYWDESISPSPDEDGEYFARILISADQVFFSEGINFYRKMDHANSLSKSFSYQRAINLLNSVELKFSHLFKVEDSNHIWKLYQTNISQVAYQFGVQYPEILNKAKSKLQNRKLSISEPFLFAFISRFIGFGNTMRVKALCRKIRVFSINAL
jgi:glycosyltransferase involved in cell wall biosynthesis